MNCLCGGNCTHVIATCLDCAESASIQYQHVAAFEHRHVTPGPGHGSRAHAVIVTHTSPRTGGPGPLDVA